MFDLTQYLAERRAFVEQHLEACLPPANRRPAVLSQAMRHAVLTGGKRLRAIICLAACEAAGGRHEAAIAPAAAIEYLHCYTLIHDDLPCMDNDTMRRGQPTVWYKFGEANAVLAGDALQAFAFAVLGNVAADQPHLIGRLALELAAAAGADGVIGGQVEDLAFAGKTDMATLAYIHSHKTAALFRAAARLGAITAHAADDIVNALGEFGDALGNAFQIIDDLLDAIDGRPIKPQEFSCLHLLSQQQAREMATTATDKACAALDRVANPPGTTPLRLLARQLLERLT